MFNFYYVMLILSLIAISQCVRELPQPVTTSRPSSRPPLPLIHEQIFTTGSPYVGGNEVPAVEISQHADIDDQFVPFKTDNNDLFDWKILKEILLNDQSNVVLSPYSIKFILTLLSFAAGNETLTLNELLSVTPNLRNPAAIRELYRNTLRSLKETNDGYKLSIGTGFFVDEFIIPQQKFATIARTDFDTVITQLKFSDSEMAAQTINHWTNNITHGHIPQLVQRSDVEKSIMLLINAIYFEGVWKTPFLVNNTYEFSFYRQPMEQVRATYMTQISNFSYFESKKLDSKIVRLPYEGGKFAMTIVLPNSKGGLNELIRQVQGDRIKQLQYLMEPTLLKVTIPRMKFEYTSQLKETLESIGITEIFSDSASLPGLARGLGTNNLLRVSNIIQKAGLIVDESGSKAFAATEIIIANKFGESLEEFNANRPFMFLIEDETSGTILFAGKVTDPTTFL